MFNKAIRKFTNLCKATYEKQIATEIEDEEMEAKQVLNDLHQ